MIHNRRQPKPVDPDLAALEQHLKMHREDVIARKKFKGTAAELEGQARKIAKAEAAIAELEAQIVKIKEQKV